MLLAKKVSPRKIIVPNGLAEPIRNLIVIFIGNLICAIGFNGFIIPNKLISGGVTGTGIMIHYLIGLPTGLIIFLINIPIFILGARIIDRKFAIYSFISMMTISSLIEITHGIGHFIQINDLLIETIIGGALNGIGMGILFRNRVSQGGMDIIAAIFKKKFNMEIGAVLLSVNGTIICLSSILFGMRLAMYTLISLFICYQIVDKIQLGLDTKKTVIIVSNKPQQLADEIMQKLSRGVTFLNGEGGYNKDTKKIIYCTVTSTQVGKIKSLIDEIDPDAFITINSVQEVKGRGFKSIGF